MIVPLVLAMLQAYDPLRLPEGLEIRPVDLTIGDPARSREIPVRVYLPPGTGAAPVVLFSHGLGGNREGSGFLGRHWAARGYAVVFLQHPGSDESVWKEVPAGRRMAAMQQAASLENFMLRVKDVGAVLDALPGIESLSGRLDLKRVGMSGHSFGAQTTQAVAGQAFPGGRSLADPRIRAALPLSPSSPKAGSPAAAFGAVPLPWLLITGTKDGGLIGGQTPETRMAVYPALPAGSKYELVLDGAEHSAFTERALPGETGARNPNHHRAVLAIGTAFWDAYLREDPAARAWLDGDGPGGVLEEKDRWQRK